MLLTEQLAPPQSTTDSNFEAAGAALGNMLGLAMVDSMVNAVARPEAVMRAMQDAGANCDHHKGAAKNSIQAPI